MELFLSPPQPTPTSTSQHKRRATLNISQISTVSLNSISAPGLPPSASDAAQFRSLAEIEGSNSLGNHYPQNSAINKQPVAPTTMGDGETLQALSNSLQSISSGIREKTLAIGEIVAGHQRPPTVSEMLKVQMDIAQLSLQTQWVGDIVNKAGKNIDQLTHLQ